MDTETLKRLVAEAKETNTLVKGDVASLWGRIEQLDAKIDEQGDDLAVRIQKTALDDDRIASVRSGPAGPFLSLAQNAAPRFLARLESPPNYRAEEVRFGALVAAIAGGDQVRRHLRDSETMALQNMTGPGGGYLVPEAIGSLFIDAVRPRSRVLEAGALTYPMEAPTVRLPGWDAAVLAKWRAEGGPVFEDTPKFRSVNLQAKTVAVCLTLTWEIFEDAGDRIGAISAILEAEMSKALGQAVDLAALQGSGTDAEPLGLFNAADVNLDVNVVSLGANGAVPADYDFLLDAIFEVENDNFDPTAVLYSARTAKTLRKIKTGLAGDKTALIPPERVRELRTLVTNQIPNTLTQGTSTDCSAAFAGQWSELVIGFRPDLGLRLLTDPFTKAKDAGSVVIYAWLRADVALLNPKAFAIVKGIRP